MRPLLPLLCLAGVACAPPSHLTPSSGPTSGHFTVTAQDDALSALDGALTVTVGGVRALNVARVDSRTVRFDAQGHPSGGEQPVVVSTRHASVDLGAFRYTAPKHPALARVVAMGASLTMGCQDASLSMRSQLHSPALQLTDAAGAYLGMPLLVPDAVPSLTLADIDPATCMPKNADVFHVIGERAMASIPPKIADHEGHVNLGRLRADPTLTATNVAIGGFRITEVVDHSKSPYGVLLEHVVANGFQLCGYFELKASRNCKEKPVNCNKISSLPRAAKPPRAICENDQGRYRVTASPWSRARQAGGWRSSQPRHPDVANGSAGVAHQHDQGGHEQGRRRKGEDHQPQQADAHQRGKGGHEIQIARQKPTGGGSVGVGPADGKNGPFAGESPEKTGRGWPRAAGSCRRTAPGRTATISRMLPGPADGSGPGRCRRPAGAASTRPARRSLPKR